MANSTTHDSGQKLTGFAAVIDVDRSRQAARAAAAHRDRIRSLRALLGADQTATTLRVDQAEPRWLSFPAKRFYVEPPYSSASPLQPQVELDDPNYGYGGEWLKRFAAADMNSGIARIGAACGEISWARRSGIEWEDGEMNRSSAGLMVDLLPFTPAQNREATVSTRINISGQSAPIRLMPGQGTAPADGLVGVTGTATLTLYSDGLEIVESSHDFLDAWATHSVQAPTPLIWNPQFELSGKIGLREGAGYLAAWLTFSVSAYVAGSSQDAATGQAIVNLTGALGWDFLMTEMADIRVPNVEVAFRRTLPTPPSGNGDIGFGPR